MNRRRMFILAMLGISLVAFFVDRGWLSDPKGASAAVPDEALVPVPPPATPPTTDDETSSKEKRSARDWLDRLPKPKTMRDAFSLGGVFLENRRLRQQQQLEQQQALKNTELNPLKVFAADHTLQMTLVSVTSSETSLATVDDEVLRIGDRIGEFRLSHIDWDEVKFIHEPSRETVSLFLEPAAR